MNFKSIKIQLNLFLATFALFLFLREPAFSIVAGLFFAVLFSVLTEGVILYVKTKKIQITASAITSGLILGLVFSSESPWWMFLTLAILTIGLKHLVRFHGKNLFNPATLGIFLVVLLLKGYTEWKGAYVWYVLVPAGLYLVYKIKKMELALGYFLTSLLLFIPQALKQGTPILEIFGYFNYFFIFIMMIEPKTTPAQRWPKFLFGAGVALLVFLLTEWSFRYEPELFALLILNALTPWLNKIPNFKLPAFPPLSKKESSMKKMSAFLIVLLLISMNAFAHPPSDIKITFDTKTQTVTASIAHAVSNPLTHYINKVDIGLNGTEIKTIPFKQQYNRSTQDFTEVIFEAKAGDTISVEAYCNLSGKLKKEITVTWP